MLSVSLLMVVTQKQPFDVIEQQGWAREQFELLSEEVQQKLAKYHVNPKIQQQLPKDADHAAQLSHLTTLAAAEFGSWLSDMSHRLSKYDITSEHPHAELAAEVVQEFIAGSKHALDSWSDAAQAAEHMHKLLCYLQLKPVECESAEAAIVHAAHTASQSTSLTEQLYSSVFQKVRTLSITEHAL